MSKREKRLQRQQAKRRQTDFSPEGIGLDRAEYEATIRFLFDKPVPDRRDRAWYWNMDEPAFEATPLE
jgi:hypothetical protein